MSGIPVLIFAIVSGALIYISRRSLIAPRSHGFYRFFAFEAILGAFLLNVGGWFNDPFSWHQLISWPLLVIALFLVIHGVHLLRLVGKPDVRRDDASLLGVEKTLQLVTVGAYRYIRHPMYSSLLFLAWGIFFKDPAWLVGILALIATIALVMTAKAEEVEDISYFGEAYRKYMKHTKMFVPYLF